MPIVRLDARQIVDWVTFHDVFAQEFGFPEFYGRNLNAWIDCMSDLDDPAAGMTSVHGKPSDPVIIQIDNVTAMRRDIYDALVECSAFVNWRRIDNGESAILCLAYWRQTC